MKMKVVSTAERPCAECGATVRVVYGRDSLRPMLFDPKPETALVPGDDGLWQVERVMFVHECERKDGDGEG